MSQVCRNQTCLRVLLPESVLIASVALQAAEAMQLQKVALPQAVLRLLRGGAVLQPLHLPELLQQGGEPVRSASEG